jgi:hypothetical protein
MTRKQRVLRSFRVPTYTPTTSGSASNSLSCAAKTALISRFGEGELVWAMFGRQPTNRISVTASRVRIPCRTSPRSCIFNVDHVSGRRSRLRVNIWQLLLRSPSVPDHRGAKECKHVADGICDRRRAASRKKQTHRSRICRNIFDHQ